MSDSTLEDIKSGKGLAPLNTSTDASKQTGITTEQRGEKGISFETFTDHSKDNK